MPIAAAVRLPTVLVIDDSPELHDLYALLLGSEGYGVVLAASLDQARAALTTTPPDLVLSEVCLPDTAPCAVLDLLAAAADAAIRSLPLVLCTGALDQVAPAAARLAAAGVTVVAKPFDINDLLSALRHATMPHQGHGRCREVTPMPPDRCPTTARHSFTTD